MSRVLVTGGAGFIGSHLCRRLIKDGHEVICIDNMITGSYANITDCLQCNSFSFFNEDVTHSIPDFEVDYIYNLACPASPVHYQYDPIKTAQTNFLGAFNALELARKNHARILQASTSEIYGNPNIHPQSESYNGNVSCIGPRSCYDEGKRIAETLFFDYYRKYGTDIRVVRIFNTYGPYMSRNDGRVISNFVVAALLNKDITIYGDGMQTRSFCYVDDLIGGLILMMQNDDFIGPMNLGNPEELRVIDLANLIIKKLNSSSRIVFDKLPADDPIRRKPDITLAMKYLKWRPEVDIIAGIDRTVEYFKNS